MGAGVLRRAHQRHGLAHRRVQIPCAAAQLGGHLLAGTVLDEPAGQLRLHALRLGAAGQQQRAFHLHQMGRHVDEFAGDIQMMRLHGLDSRGVLVDERHDVHIIQVHLILADQIQK